MTWIRTIPLSKADAELRAAVEAQRALYPAEYQPPAPRSKAAKDSDDDAAEIVAAHSLIPDALCHAFATFGVLLSPKLPLSRRQHEMIATVVSVTNRCHY
jgi:hypothetical protein